MVNDFDELSAYVQQFDTYFVIDYPGGINPDDGSMTSRTTLTVDNTMWTDVSDGHFVFV